MSIIVIDSSKLTSGSGSEMNITFSTPIINKNLNLEIAVIKINTWYSIHNIASAFSNNTITISSNGGGVYADLTIPDGNYTIEDLSTFLSDNTSANITLTPNYATSKTYITLGAGYRVRFSTCTGIAELLGFDHSGVQGTVIASGYGLLRADLNRGITCFHLRTDSIKSTYDNSSSSNILFQFVPRSAPNSSIDVEPANLIYHQLRDTVISGMNFTLTDQSGNLLDLNGEDTVLMLHIRQKP